jgi:hypothetical protein
LQRGGVRKLTVQIALQVLEKLQDLPAIVIVFAVSRKLLEGSLQRNPTPLHPFTFPDI